VSRRADTRPIPPGIAYAEGVLAGRWQDDPAQRAALVEFDRLFAALSAAPPGGLLARLRKPRPVRGLYLWGGVGRGKTFLVDLFFEHLPTPAKKRVHFHRFMGEVHARLRDLGQHSDPLLKVARDYARDLRVLCLDEFFVSDIGDAMILARLLQGLFDHGVTLVTTSNTVPANLYRDGLQRSNFLPAIALLQEHCVVHRMDSATDYRLRTLSRGSVYHHPLGRAADAALRELYERLTADTVHEGEPLRINDRPIPAIDHCDGVAWLDFTALCEGPRSAADYIEIARDFHTVLLADVPALGTANENAARRFVHLIDELYDRHVNLILSAAVPLTALYQGDKLRHEFQRTESRLIEMQGEAYLASEHRP